MGIFISLNWQKRNSRENSAIIHCLFFQFSFLFLFFHSFVETARKWRQRKLIMQSKWFPFVLYYFSNSNNWRSQEKKKMGVNETRWCISFKFQQQFRHIKRNNHHLNWFFILFLFVSWLFFDLKKGFFMKKHWQIKSFFWKINNYGFRSFCEGFNHTQNYKNINKNNKNETPYFRFLFFFGPLISGSVCLFMEYDFFVRWKTEWDECQETKNQHEQISCRFHCYIFLQMN